jgi:hypothetical protein
VNTSPTQPSYDDDSIDLRELWRRLMRGLPLALGLGALGLVVAALLYLVVSPFATTETSTRVVFGFSGYEQGLYPDGSRFQSDDLRAPEIVSEALKRLGLETNESLQSQIRSALNIEGVIPADVVKARDRLRAAGQTPAPYLPDEYRVSLTLPRRHALPTDDRARLLNEIVSAYLQRFARTYVAVPLQVGTAFDSLTGLDYFDYELLLSRESRNVHDYLSRMQEKAPTFRSKRSNLTFGDLAKQNELFTQIRLNEVLGLIRQEGLSGNRQVAMMKMDYYLRSLEDREIRAVEEEGLVRDLLRQAQERSQQHVLGVRSPIGQQRPESPMIDQGLVDSLLANDAYNFLVRQALAAGLRTRDIQSEKAILLERRRKMQGFMTTGAAEQGTVIAQLEHSLAALRDAYDRLMADLRLTHEDYQTQEFGNAVRVSMQTTQASYYLALAKAGVVGAALGLALGMGLSLLGVLGAGRIAA